MVWKNGVLRICYTYKSYAYLASNKEGELCGIDINAYHEAVRSHVTQTLSMPQAKTRLRTKWKIKAIVNEKYIYSSIQLSIHTYKSFPAELSVYYDRSIAMYGKTYFHKTTLRSGVKHLQQGFLDSHAICKLICLSVCFSRPFPVLLHIFLLLYLPISLNT